MLAKDGVFLADTIKKCAKGFPECLKGVKPPKGSYLAHSVDDKRYIDVLLLTGQNDNR